MLRKKKKPLKQQSRQQEILCTSVECRFFDWLMLIICQYKDFDGMECHSFCSGVISCELWFTEVCHSLKSSWETYGFPSFFLVWCCISYENKRHLLQYSSVSYWVILFSLSWWGVLTKLNYDPKVEVNHRNVFKDG